jgi:hypothetical protein
MTAFDNAFRIDLGSPAQDKVLVRCLEMLSTPRFGGDGARSEKGRSPLPQHHCGVAATSHNGYSKASTTARAFQRKTQTPKIIS